MREKQPNNSHEDRRCGADRRQFAYTEYIPERRDNQDRRRTRGKKAA